MQKTISQQDLIFKKLSTIVNFGVFEKVGESRRGTHYVMMKR